MLQKHTRCIVRINSLKGKMLFCNTVVLVFVLDVKLKFVWRLVHVFSLHSFQEQVRSIRKICHSVPHSDEDVAVKCSVL